MIANPDGNLHVYMLNVGQGDTSIIVSPQGKVIVIDATQPDKLIRLLDDLGLDGNVEHLIITHPHDDHFRGGNRLVKENTVLEATLAPFWHEFGMGPPTYRKLVERLANQKTKTTFLAGYSRWYPDGTLTSPAPGGAVEVDPNAPYLEILGPTNGLVRMLEDAKIFNANHLTIMTRLTWGRFRMISTGDAQMENWGHFDNERLMEDKCQVLRAAHHGSPNGTQWERLTRLGSSKVIVSSDPGGGHHLPDLTATAIFAKYDSVDHQMATVTRDTGTIHLRVRASGAHSLESYGDGSSEKVDLSAGVPLTETSNPTDWTALLESRVAGLSP